MTKFPKISVIVPAYNEETKIEKCLKALLNQEYEPIEIILINNGSTDRTGEIAENLSKENKK